MVLEVSRLRLMSKLLKRFSRIDAFDLLKRNGFHLFSDTSSAPLFPRVGYHTTTLEYCRYGCLELSSTIAIGCSNPFAEHAGRMKSNQRHFCRFAICENQHLLIAQLSKLGKERP